MIVATEKKQKSGEIICALNDILFDVEKVQISDFDCNSDYAYDIYAYPNGEKLRVNSCSNRYELIPNSEIFPVIRQILTANGIEFTESYSHINHARFYANYVIEDQRFAYKVKGSTDVIKPMLKVNHSYNGLTKYGIVFGYYRLVCSNGLTIPVQEMNEYNLAMQGKHTESVKKSFEMLNSTLQYFAKNAAQITLAITAKYDSLADSKIVNVDQRIEEVLNNNSISIINNLNKTGQSTVDYIRNVINSEVDLYGGVTNDFLVYNGINRYINDPDLNIKTPEKRSELDSKVLESMLAQVN